MRCFALALLGGLALAACGSSPGPSTPTAVPSPAIVCGDFAASQCESAAAAALRVFGPETGVPVLVELSGSVFCESPSFLFTTRSCPMPFPSAGAPAIGSAVVTFAGTPAHGYLNLWMDASSGVHAALIAVATPPPASPSGQ